jgi:hypothetical protein
MLDLNHPMTAHIFRASGLIDGVMAAAQIMTVSPSVVRNDLLAKCLPRFVEMRELNREQFGDSTYIASAIDEYEAGIRKLAGLGDGQIVEDRRNGEGECPFCHTPITKFNPMPGRKGYEDRFVILCGHCDDLYMPGLSKLRSTDGFGTDWI